MCARRLFYFQTPRNVANTAAAAAAAQVRLPPAAFLRRSNTPNRVHGGPASTRGRSITSKRYMRTPFAIRYLVCMYVCMYV